MAMEILSILGVLASIVGLVIEVARILRSRHDGGKGESKNKAVVATTA